MDNKFEVLNNYIIGSLFIIGNYSDIDKSDTCCEKPTDLIMKNYVTVNICRNVPNFQ